MIRKLSEWPLREGREDYYTILVEVPGNDGRFPSSASGYHCMQAPRNELGITLDRLEELGLTTCAVLIPQKTQQDMGCYVQTHDGFSLMMGWNYGCMCLYAPEGDPLAEDVNGVFAMARHYNDLLRDEVIEPWWEISEYREFIEEVKEKGGKHDTGS